MLKNQLVMGLNNLACICYLPKINNPQRNPNPNSNPKLACM